jgi:hypothetical protein
MISSVHVRLDGPKSKLCKNCDMFTAANLLASKSGITFFLSQKSCITLKLEQFTQ